MEHYSILCICCVVTSLWSVNVQRMPGDTMVTAIINILLSSQPQTCAASYFIILTRIARQNLETTHVPHGVVCAWDYSVRSALRCVGLRSVNQFNLRRTRSPVGHIDSLGCDHSVHCDALAKCYNSSRLSRCNVTPHFSTTPTHTCTIEFSLLNFHKFYHFFKISTHFLTFSEINNLHYKL